MQRECINIMRTQEIKIISKQREQQINLLKNYPTNTSVMKINVPQTLRCNNLGA